MSNFFTNTLLKKIYKYLYKISHSKSYNHNRRYWPYFKVERNTQGFLNKVFYKNKLIADNTTTLKSNTSTCVIVATGPSVNQIDSTFFQKKQYDYIGLNGAIHLNNSKFKYYIIIDHNFIENKFDLVIDVLETTDCTFFTTPRCLELILRKYSFEKIKCTFKVIETITENKIERLMGAKMVLTSPIKNCYSENNVGFSTEIHDAVYDYYTVAYVALQIAYTLNYKKILLVGFDMSNFNQPRFYESISNKQPTRLEQDFSAISIACDVAERFFEKKQIQIFNLSIESSIEVFKKASFRQFL